MQTRSNGLNVYFEIAMCNKSHIEIFWYIVLCWHKFINDLHYESSENAHGFPKWVTAKSV